MIDLGCRLGGRDGQNARAAREGRLSEKIGSGAEAENVELMKSGEEDGRFYRVKG